MDDPPADDGAANIKPRKQPERWVKKTCTSPHRSGCLHSKRESSLTSLFLTTDRTRNAPRHAAESMPPRPTTKTTRINPLMEPAWRVFRRIIGGGCGQQRGISSWGLPLRDPSVGDVPTYIEDGCYGISTHRGSLGVRCATKRDSSTRQQFLHIWDERWDFLFSSLCYLIPIWGPRNGQLNAIRMMLRYG